MLESARDHYRRQQNLTARAVAEARRRANRGLGSVAQAIRAYQVLAITLALQAGAAELAEQNIAKLFMAGVIPGLLQALFYAVVVGIMFRAAARVRR